MKYILMLSILLAGPLMMSAQVGSGGNGKSGGSRAATNGSKSAAQSRGSGQYHGSKDTTPGSPMGTGGAGGSGMSGSPAGSASENTIHHGKANGQGTNSGTNQSSTSKKVDTESKKRKPGSKKM